MGEVYEALDHRRNRVVALKLLPPALSADPTYVERFRREAQIAAQLDEPHIIPIHDFGELDGVLFIDMRLVPGEDLRSLLRRGGRLSAARATSICSQVASALQAAHARGLEHRDVKPENILLTGDDFAYLADFGIAVRETDRSLTDDGSTIGSFDYLAPERFGPGRTGPAADQYALACVLYECVTGQPPYPAGTLAQKANGHLNSPVPRIPAAFATPALSAAVARGMAKDPADRFPQVTDLTRAPSPGAAPSAATQIAWLPAGAGPEALTVARRVPTTPASPSTSALSATNSSSRRSPVLLAMLVVVGLLLAGGGWWLSQRGGSTGAGTQASTADSSGATAASQGSAGAPRTSPVTDGSNSATGATAATSHYPIANAAALVLPVGGSVPVGVQAYANAVQAGDVAQIIRRCWTYAPERIRAQQTQRDGILNAFARNTSSASTELGPGWTDGSYVVSFSYSEAQSLFACPTVSGPGIDQAVTVADATTFVNRLNGRIIGKPVNSSDTITGYWLICDPVNHLPNAQSRDTSSDAAYFTSAEKAAIATLAAGPLTVSAGDSGTVVRPAGQSTPSITFGSHAVNLCLDSISP